MKKIYPLLLLLCHFFSVSGQSDLTENLIAHYPFNDSAVDITGHGHDGTLIGPVPATDRFSQDSTAFDFDGVDDYIEISDHPDLVFGDSAFSIVAWIYPEAWTGNSGLNCIISKANADEGAWVFRVVNSSQTGYVAKLNFEGVWPSQRFFANSEVTLNEWHMVALTRNGDNFIFYLDGVADGSFTYSKTFISTFPVRISGQGDVTNERFNGRIDDVFIYGKELGTQEISDLYNLTQNACLEEPYFSYDGQIYTTVQVGYQCWMAENLKTTTFSNGTPIPNVTDASSWQNLTSAAFIWYDNDITWKDKYGALYNWYSTVDPNGLCPSGWHIPTNSEWDILTGFIGGTGSPHGNELKSCRQVDSPLWGACSTTEHPRWDQGIHWGTDDYNFSGLPGGNRDHLGGFYSLGRSESWWSSTSVSQWGAISYLLGYNEGNVSVTEYHKRYGFSVRCLKDDFPPDPPENPLPEHGSIDISVDTLFSWTCSHPLNLPLHYSFYLGTDPNPPYLEGNITDTTYSPGLLNYDETYYWKVIAVDVLGDSTQSDIWSFTTNLFGCGNPFIDNRDGMAYETVLIGNQCWMAENLNYGAYIPGNIDQTQNGYTEKYCYYDDPNYCDTLGGLYEWSEAMVYWTLPNQVCPYGWHIPLDAEICTLEQEVDSTITCDSFNWRGIDGGTKLKEGGSSGMDILFAGYHEMSGAWNGLGEFGHFWAQDIEFSVYAFTRGFDINHSGINRNSVHAEFALPVRCLLNNDPPNAPSNPTPDIGDAGLPVEPELSWECSDPDGNPLTYDVYLGLENDLILIASGLDTTVCVADSLIPGTMYYWQVVAYDIHGAHTTGDMWYFSTDGYSYSEFLWAEQAGSVNNDSFEGICLDASGNSLVTGYFDGTATFGDTILTSSGQKDIVVAKLDKDGNYLWAKRAGGSEEDIGYGITCDDAGNAYITGRFRNSADFGATTLVSYGDYDVFIAKIDPSGNFVWAKQAGGLGGDGGYGIDMATNGDLFLTGYFSVSSEFGGFNLVSSGGIDIFITRLDTVGNFKWATAFGGASGEYVFDITTDQQSNGIITGWFSGTISFGIIYLTSQSNDIFVAKLDSLGNYIWAISAGGKLNDEGHGISCDGGGNTYITGYIQDTAYFGGITTICQGTDIYSAKIDPTGTFQWVTSAGTAGNFCQGLDIYADNDGNSYLAGYFSGTVSIANTILNSYGMQDILAAKVDKNGEFLWAVQAGGALVDRALGISAESNGNVALAGLFRDNATFGEFQRTSVGLDDAFVARIGNSFSCGRPIYDPRDTLWYNTVQVGQQCWMAENLNTGARIDGSLDQTDNGITEKYCYNDDPANCNTYGGLYEWEEAIAYSTETGQICPPGWRIPSDGEICTLEQSIDTSITCSSTGWRGTDGGTKLKQGGSSGMDILLAGVHRDDDVWEGEGQFGNFWAQDVEFGINAWYRGVDLAYTQIFRNSLPAEYALPVRCVFDNAPPIAPHDPVPVHGSIDIYPAAELGWSCSDPDLDPLTYDIYLGTDSIPQLLVSGLTETWFTTDFLTPDTVIFWKVVARDIHGAETSSDIWEFRTIPFDCGNTTFQYAGITYGTVEYKNRCWLDRNLGASQVATAWDDPASYGYYNQWGRFLDGHQIPASATTTTLSSTDDPGHGDFILASGLPHDWRDPQNDSLWQDALRTNNPCPGGFYVPSETEWTDASAGWTTGTNGYNSPLKLSATGYRSRVDGALGLMGSDGYYQSSSISGYNHVYLWVGSGAGMYYNGERAGGIAVRCIMENIPPAAPYDPFPPHGSTDRWIADTLKWKCRDDNGDQLRYNIYWGFDPDPPLMATSWNHTFYANPLFPYDTTIYWRIEAFDHADTVSGPLWSFQTGSYNGEEYIWAKRVSGSGYINGEDIATDDIGNIYATGRFSDYICFGNDTLYAAGAYDIYIVKLDPDGNHIWAVSAGGTEWDRGYGISPDPNGNVYVTGCFRGTAYFGAHQVTSYGSNDYFICKLDPNGNFLWADHWGASGSDTGSDICTDTAGNAYLIGTYYDGSGWGGVNYYQVIVHKYLPDGWREWMASFGGSSNDSGSSICSDDQGNCYITGYFGDTIVIVNDTLATHGSYDAFVAKISSDGIWQWARDAGGSYSDYGRGITLNKNGQLFITGTYVDQAYFGDLTLAGIGQSDIFTAMLDTAGNFKWVLSYGGTTSDYAYGIVADDAGGVYSTGSFSNNATFGDTTLFALRGQGLFVSKCNGSGSFEWARTAENTSGISGKRISVDDEANLYITGDFYTHALFGSQYLYRDNNYVSAFLARVTEGQMKEVSLKVMLQGPYNGSSMNTSLNPANLPLSHPYSDPPWNYNGYDEVVALPSGDIVDWALVELRDAPDASSATSGTRVARKATFIKSDGAIVGLDGSSNLFFNEGINHGMYAVIWHRNHLAVMSSQSLKPTSNIYSFDFSTGESQAYGGGNAHIEVSPGVWGMIGGDGNADGQINNGDKNDVWAQEAGSGGYKAGDFNMDVQVNNGDKNDIWNPNTGLGSQVPNELRW